MNAAAGTELIIRGALHQAKCDMPHLSKVAMNALTTLATSNADFPWASLVGLMNIESDLSPLALLTAIVLMDDPPATLRAHARAKSRESLRLLNAPECADLRKALRAALQAHPSRVHCIIDTLAARDVLCDDRACRALLGMDDSIAIILLLRLMASGAPHDEMSIVRACMLQSIAHDPRMSVTIGGIFWMDLFEAERVHIACAVAHDPHYAADLLTRIGSEGWQTAPKKARQALIPSIARSPWTAARGGSVVWRSLNDDERAAIAHAAASVSSCAADFMKRLSSVGWGLAPHESRVVLMDAVASDPWSAASAGGEVWSGMSEGERNAIAFAAAREPSSAAALMTRIGAAGWHGASSAARQALLNAAISDPDASARGIGYVWSSLNDAEREMCSLVLGSASDVAAIMMYMGPSGWRMTSESTRSSLLKTVRCDPAAAARAGGKVWNAMNEAEKEQIARAVAHFPSCAADLMKTIGADGWKHASAAVHAALVQSVIRDPRAAVCAISAVWDALDADERESLATAIARNSDAAGACLTLLCEAGRCETDDAIRTALLDAIVCDPHLVARISADIWDAMRDRERQRLAWSVAFDARCAVAFMDKIGPAGWKTIPADARASLLNAVVCASQTECPVGLLIARGGGAVWEGMSDDERLAIARAISDHPSAVANLLSCIGAEGWRRSPESARQLLMGAIGNAPHAAALAGARIWSGLNERERMTICKAATRSAGTAAHLLTRIGGDTLAMVDPSMRADLIGAACRSPRQAHCVAVNLRDSLTNDEWVRVVQSAMRVSHGIAELVEAFSRDRWTALPEKTRADIIKALSLDAHAAAQGGGRIWGELNESAREIIAESAARSSRAAAHLIERFGVGGWDRASPRVRTTLLSAVARSPEAAAKALLTIGDRALGDARAALARTALGGAAASRPIAQALIAGAPWRDWMDGFLPGCEHDDATLTDWRTALHHIDSYVAARTLARLPLPIASRIMPRSACMRC